MTERLRQEYQKQGDDLDIMLKRVDEKGIAIRREIEHLAEEQARLDFIINDIAQKESVTVEQDDIVNNIQMIAQQSNLKKHQVKKLMEDEAFLISIYRSLLTRRVTNFLLNHAKRDYCCDEHEHAHDESKNHSEHGESESGLIISG